MLSGRRLDLLDPSPLDVEIEDIAHGLARVAREHLVDLRRLRVSDGIADDGVAVHGSILLKGLDRPRRSSPAVGIL